MKYRIVSIVNHNGVGANGIFNNIILYKLQKKGWFGIWWTKFQSRDKSKLESLLIELNKEPKVYDIC